MKRKLISYDAFDKIQKGSLSNAQQELTEAEEVLSCTLDKGELSLHCFGESNVLYGTHKGTFVRADYNINEGYINFENIEEVVIDQETHNANIKNTISEMLDAILEGEEARAEEGFGQYLTEASMKLKMRKTHYLGGDKGKSQSEKMASNMKGNVVKEEATITDRTSAAPDPARSRAAKLGNRRNAGNRRQAAQTRKKHASKIKAKHRTGAFKLKSKMAKKKKDAGHHGARVTNRIADNVSKKKAKAYMETVNHVFDYINYVSAAPILQESNVVRNEEGNIVSATVPTRRIQNEAKLLSLKWDTLKTDVKVIRESALRLSENNDFCKKIAELKRFNNISDDESLTEALNQLVVNWPAVLYLTQEELAATVGNALEIVGESNYDDNTCKFMAEGILRVAHKIHPDRVGRLASLAKVEVPADSTDPFVEFQHLVKDFYVSLDESTQTENSILEDLRDIVLDIRHAAAMTEENTVREDANDYLESIDEVLSGNSIFNIELASEVADWVNQLIETNLETSAWNVVKTPFRTTTGDHPDMAKKAGQGYSPRGDSTGDWGAELPAVSDDGGSYKGGSGAKTMKSSWSTGMAAGPDTYPALNNPYCPKPFGDYKIKGEKHVDSDNATGQWGSGDTWPNLNNPYIPSDVRVHTNNDNRVDDVESRVGLSQTSDLDQKIS